MKINERLDVNNKLFIELRASNPKWWGNLISDEDIYVDIRKDNGIDIFHNGGAIIRELKYYGSSYTGSIHYKYLLPKESEYIKYIFDSSNVRLSKEKNDLLNINDFDNNSLKRIKNNIETHYPSSSEAGIKAKFVNKSGGFIDTEVRFIVTDPRIDLVWIDKTNKKIVFVELKNIGNSELFSNKITDQLKKYCVFAQKYEKEVVGYYKKLFIIKKNLGILPDLLKSISSLNGFTLEMKPLLLLGDCKRKWIDNNAEDINSRIKNLAVGAYYFGKPGYNCDLIPKTRRNQYIF